MGRGWCGARGRAGWAVGAVAAWLLMAAPAAGQQTIINVPSIEQTKAGRVFFLHESKVRAWGGTTKNVTTHFLTYGVTPNVEIAATLYNVGTRRERYTAAGVGYKAMREILPRRLPQWELKVGGGQMLQRSLRGDGLGLWSYAHASARIPALDLRLTGGVSAGPRQTFGFETVHFIGSYEWHLAGPVELVGEWWSGRHEFADFVPGLSVHVGDWVLILGYAFSNQPGTDSDGLIVEVGRTF